MTTPKIILLRGKAQSGKSTCANQLEEGWGYEILSFAAPIHKLVATLIGINGDEVPNHMKNIPLKVLGGKTPRQVMQSLGTEWGRSMVNEKLWTSVVIEEIVSIMDTNGVTHFCISDYRFDNEYQDLVDAFGEENILVLHIQRGIDASGMGKKELVHASENGIKIEPKQQIIIKNDSTKETFLDEIDWIMMEIDIGGVASAINLSKEKYEH